MFKEFNTITETTRPNIKIIGIGGGGNNAVNKMANDKIEGVDFLVANTDAQVLNASVVTNRMLIGHSTTAGLGAGANPEVGESAAKESLEDIKLELEGANLVFIAAGLGGGTGTGAAPIFAEVAKESGAVVIGIVTTPFSFEGRKRLENSADGLKKLVEHVDALIVVSNDRLLDELGDIPFTESFKYSDAILKQAVRTIVDIINEQSMINLDFADVKTIIEGQGQALIGVGKAAGDNAPVEAAIKAINSPLLDSSIEGAQKAIVNVAGSSKSLTISKAKQAVETIKEAATSNIDVIFGVTINEALGEEIVVSVIATGLSKTRTDVQTKSTDLDILLEETDIDRYREISSTREFNPKDFDDILAGSATTENSFSSFSLLDDDDDDDGTIEDLLG